MRSDLPIPPSRPARAAVPVTVMSADGEKTIEVDERAEPPIEGRFVNLGRYQFEKNGQSYVLISNEGTDGHVIADAVVFIPAGSASPRRPEVRPRREGSARCERWSADLKRLKAEGRKRPMVMSVLEEPQIGDTRVHIRGSVHTLGETVPRGFLRVATLDSRPSMPSAESGRRELAAWLASRDNPLTARVFVNRAWHWLFGAGIVRTTDNFGTTGELPSHPELLDDLAVRFSDEGWSLKTLVRRIVLSRTYQLSTQEDSRALAADPENRLLWRANRRRLDAECLRDALLVGRAAGSRIEMGGPTFPAELAADYGFKHSDTRRSVYLPVFRNSLPDLFEVFDFADPSMVVGRRNVSTVAPQALFLLNHPFVLDQASEPPRSRLPGRAWPPRRFRTTGSCGPTGGRSAAGPREAGGRNVVARKSSSLEGKRGKRCPKGPGRLVFQALFASMDFRYSP